MNRQDVAKMVLKAIVASAPFTGGLAQIWSDLDGFRQQKETNEILASLKRYLESPDSETRKVDLLRVIDAFQTATTKEEENWLMILERVLLAEIPRQLSELRIESRSGQVKAIEKLLDKSIFLTNVKKGVPYSSFFEDLAGLKAFASLASNNLGVTFNATEGSVYPLFFSI